MSPSKSNQFIYLFPQITDDTRSQNSRLPALEQYAENIAFADARQRFRHVPRVCSYESVVHGTSNDYEGRTPDTFSQVVRL